jgi:peroxiredoxin
VRGDLVTGSTFPNYELLDHQGQLSSVLDLQGRDPLLVLLAHGTFCAEEHWFHERLVGLWRAFNLGSVGVVTITTDDLLDTNNFRDRLGAPWPFLSDPSRLYQRDLDIADYTDPLHDSMVPHLFVLSPELRIHSWYVGHWLWGRPTESELWRDLRTVSRAIRPDWDLSNPGLRERWTDGHRRDFRPYRRSMRDDVELFDDQDDLRYEPGA